MNTKKGRGLNLTQTATSQIRRTENVPPPPALVKKRQPSLGKQPDAKSQRSLVPWALWSLLALWIGLTPPFMEPLNPIANTQANLQKISRLLDTYRAKFQEYPNNLAELRRSLGSLGKSLPFFDGYGERVDYIKLQDSSYLLRSFGADGIQNALIGPKDIGLVRWGKLPQGGAFYDSKPELLTHFYRAASLMGLDSPDGSWLARVFINKADQKRFLVVRHRTIPDLVMVAAHDRVEEFYWTSSNAMVFSATESLKMRDGLYLWDLTKDQTIDLLRSIKMNHTLDSINISVFSTQVERGYWVALAGFNARSRQLYAYIAMKDSYLLDPDYFFTPENLFEYTLDPNPERISAKRMTRDHFLGITVPKKFNQSPLSEKLTLDVPFVTKKPGALPVQESWLKLPKTGNLESTLLAWQQFSITHAKTPLFPYSLWYLIALYNESYLLVQSVNKRESEVLRTYGVEISLALMNDSMAPSYLKAFGAHCHQVLMTGQPLPFRLFNKLSL